MLHVVAHGREDAVGHLRREVPVVLGEAVLPRQRRRPVRAARALEDVGVRRQRDDGPAVELRRLPEADVETVQLAAAVVGHDRVREQALGEDQPRPQRHHGDAVRLQLEGGVTRDLVDRGLADSIRDREQVAVGAVRRDVDDHARTLLDHHPRRERGGHVVGPWTDLQARGDVAEREVPERHADHLREVG
jgi:hypothetical protein